jgi:hypothetical protein
LSEDYKKQREEVKALAKRKVRLLTTSNLNLYSKIFLEKVTCGSARVPFSRQGWEGGGGLSFRLIEIKIRILRIIYFLNLINEGVGPKRPTLL